MKKGAIILSTGVVVLLFSNCFKKANPTSSKKTPAEEIVYAKTHFTDEQRANGKTIFENTCAGCHDLPVPAQYTVHELDDILPEMFKKAKLSYDDAGLVKAYIIVNAKGA